MRRCKTCRYFLPVGDTPYAAQQMGWCGWVQDQPVLPEVLEIGVGGLPVTYPSHGVHCKTWAPTTEESA